MLKLQGSVCIDAPIEKVWAVLSNLESISLWVPAIHRASCPEQRRGLGAVRVCELSQATVRETIVRWEEGSSFTYRGEGAPMMKSALNTWSVEAQGPRTLVRSLAEVELKGGLFGRLLSPLVRLMSNRMGAQSMASLKYLVEQGQPHQGAQPLAAAPSSC